MSTPTEHQPETPTSSATESADQTRSNRGESEPRSPAETDTCGTGPNTLAIDVGGEGTKMLVLNSQGIPLTDRLRQLTPRPAVPEAVIGVIEEMVQGLPPFDRVSVGFPGVVVGGSIQTAPNLDDAAWRGHPLARNLQERLQRPVRVCNDADLQGYGVVLGQGVELVLTLGTGLGSALFSDGRLVPNLELAHHPFRKKLTYEQLVSNAELKRVGRIKWSRRVLGMLQQIQPIWNVQLIHIGGGNARKIKLPLPDNVRQFSNVEGLRGGIRLWD